MKCGRRNDSPLPSHHLPAEDTWRPVENGDLTCSYCGSMHPDKVLEISEKIIAGDDTFSLSGTQKSYKIYVRQKGVTNASQGGIKFYSHHAPEDPAARAKHFETVLKALQISHERFQKRMRQ